MIWMTGGVPGVVEAAPFCVTDPGRVDVALGCAAAGDWFPQTRTCQQHRKLVACYAYRRAVGLSLIIGAGNLVDKFDDRPPKLWVWNLHERFGELEPILR